MDTQPASNAITVTRRQAVSMALHVRNVHVEDKNLKLVPREIECFTEILMYGLEDKEDKSPYIGAGRKELCEILNVSSTQYSRILKRLTQIGLLMPLQKRGAYMVTPLIFEFFDFEKLKHGGIMTLYTQYNIVTDETKEST